MVIFRVHYDVTVKTKRINTWTWLCYPTWLLMRWLTWEKIFEIYKSMCSGWAKRLKIESYTLYRKTDHILLNCWSGEILIHKNFVCLCMHGFEMEEWWHCTRRSHIMVCVCYTCKVLKWWHSDRNFMFLCLSICMVCACTYRIKLLKWWHCNTLIYIIH